MEKLFPVQALNQNITHIMEKISSADIWGNIHKGLCSEIGLIDKGTPITDVSYITKCPLENKIYVKISAAYCQFLWLLSSIMIREIDFNVIKETLGQSNMSLEQFAIESRRTVNLPREQLIKEIPEKFHGINIEQYVDYLRRSFELLDVSQFRKQQKEYFELLCELIHRRDFNIDDFSIIDLKSPYAEKINSVYCFGTCFILLHELYHFSLGHLDNKNASIQDEKNADFAAFWDIYSDISPEESFSANCGILCVLFSLLHLNPAIEPDNIHPAEDDRIFEVYDFIKEENPKYTVLLVQLFRYWAEIHQIAGFPNDLQNTEESVDKIKCFLAEYKKQNNKRY